MIQTFITILAWVVFCALTLSIIAAFATRKNFQFKGLPLLFWAASGAWIIATFIN